jgi:hypothetical protein
MLVGASAKTFLGKRITVQHLGVASPFGSGDLERQSGLSQGLSVLYARCKMLNVRCKT